MKPIILTDTLDETKEILVWVLVPSGSYFLPDMSVAIHGDVSTLCSRKRVEEKDKIPFEHRGFSVFDYGYVSFSLLESRRLYNRVCENRNDIKCAVWYRDSLIRRKRIEIPAEWNPFLFGSLIPD